jgi:phosphoglycerate dehydrogenase-like enzyme
MIYSPKNPLRILTPRKEVTEEVWPGEIPVEILHMDGWHDAQLLLPKVEVLLSQVFSREMAHAAGSLKLIQAMGAGIERIDLGVLPKGCQVAIVFEHENAIAEWVIMSMIALNREAMRAHLDVRNVTWEMHVTRGIRTPPELRSQTLGVLGLGHIGKRTTELARAFGMRVIAATRTVPSEEEGLKLGLDMVTNMQGLDCVLSEADFVLLSLPLNEDTRGLIGAKELACMKPDAHLINVSRAWLVDERALFNALRDKRLKGAALDVWFQEPTNRNESPKPSKYPYWELDNVLMSPHSATMTRQMYSGRMASAAKNIDRFARGEALENVVYIA